jgi:hypothetical protein
MKISSNDKEILCAGGPFNSAEECNGEISLMVRLKEMARSIFLRGVGKVKFA